MHKHVHPRVGTLYKDVNHWRYAVVMSGLQALWYISRPPFIS